MFYSLKNLNMKISISKRNAVKASTSKPYDKPTPWDKKFGIDPYICFFELQYADKTEEEEYVELLIIQDERLVATKQNLIKSNLPYINKIDHLGPAVLHAMQDLTSGVFEHLQITSRLDVDKRANYMQCLIRGSTIKKYKAILIECNEIREGCCWITLNAQ